MTTIFILSGCLFAFSGFVVLFGAQNAPEGWEDETGFNVAWSNNSSEIADVACVWDRTLTSATA